MAAPNPLRDLLVLVPKPLRNRYVLVLAIFLIWMLFVDRRNFIDQWRLARTIQQLERDKRYYKEKIRITQEEKKALENDPERVAREKYFMHRADEEVFIIQRKDKEQ